MTDPELPARRLVAGAIGPERRPFRKDPDEPRWFEPLHVRAPRAARDAMAELVAAGADVLIAPTWLTHRRALLPTGETRRAAAWTSAAVRVAREAVETGLERRERLAEAATEPAEHAREGRDDRGDALPTVDRDVARAAAARAEEEAADGPVAAPGEVPRHPVLVAAVLPALDVAPEAGVGRLLPRDVASERDARIQAGLMVEAGADLLLVEGDPGVAQARVAVDAAVETGLPVWVVQRVSGERVPVVSSGESVGAWAESMTHAGASVLLLAPAAGAGAPEALARLRAAGVSSTAVGTLLAIGTAVDVARVAAEAQRWLEAGAWHLGIADGATPQRVAALRAVLDAIDGARLAARRAARARWDALVHDAARRAPGGRAAWVGPRHPDDVPLPTGFHWSVVAADAAASLPHGHLRLVVSVGASAERLATTLEPGGILLALVADPAALTQAGLRILDRQETGGRIALLARRDP